MLSVEVSVSCFKSQWLTQGVNERAGSDVIFIRLIKKRKSVIQKQEGEPKFLDLEVKIRSSGMRKISQKVAQVSSIWKFQKHHSEMY